MDCLSTFLTSCVGVCRPPWVFTLEVFLTEKKRWSCHVFRWMTTRVGWIDYLLIIMSIDMKGHTCHVMMCTRYCIVDLQNPKTFHSSFESKLEVFGFWWQIKKASNIWSLLRLEGVFCRYYEVQVLSFIPIHFWSVLICSWLIRIVCFSWSSSIMRVCESAAALSQLLALHWAEPLTANHG